LAIDYVLMTEGRAVSSVDQRHVARAEQVQQQVGGEQRGHHDCHDRAGEGGGGLVAPRSSSSSTTPITVLSRC
jgi:hypothetical protein